MDDRAVRDAIVAAGRRLGARGLISAGEGNLSVRLDADRLLVTPTGRRKDDLTPDDLLVVPVERPADGDAASPSGLRPSSDVAIHRAVHASRHDLGAVVHAHLPASMALTVAGERPDPAALPETAYFLPSVPVIPFAPMGSAELAGAVAAAFAPGDPPVRAVILERHGAIAIGEGSAADPATVDLALDRLELVEVLCSVWRDALLVRAARRTVGAG
jgi:L-fuculose-phosphate aldolase